MPDRSILDRSRVHILNRDIASVRKTAHEQDQILRSAPLPARVAAPTPALAIVEKYQLITASGDFGMGSVVKTVTQVPHETKTYTFRICQKRSQSGTITTSSLESSDSAVSKALSSAVKSSQGSQHSSEHSDFKLDAAFHGEMSTFEQSVDAQMNVSQSSNSVRDEFRSSVDSALDEQVSNTEQYRSVSEASSTQTQSTETEEIREETYEVSNPTGQSANFMLCQLTRERLSALSLVDVQLALYNARTGTTVQKPISGMDELLELAIADPKRRQEVRESIVKELTCIFDCMQQPRRLIEEVEFESRRFYRLVPKLKTDISLLRTDGTERSFSVPGIAISASCRLMRLPVLGIARGAASR